MSDENDAGEYDDELAAGDEAPLFREPPSNRKRLERLRREREEIEAFWKGVLASEVGRRVIWEILQEAHTFETRFACGPNGFPQREATWFQAGQQEFGQRLYHKLLDTDREGVWMMHDEHDNRFTGRNRRKDK